MLICFEVKAGFIEPVKGQHDMKKRFSLSGEIKPQTNEWTSAPEDAGLSKK